MTYTALHDTILSSQFSNVNERGSAVFLKGRHSSNVNPESFFQTFGVHFKGRPPVTKPLISFDPAAVIDEGNAVAFLLSLSSHCGEGEQGGDNGLLRKKLMINAAKILVIIVIAI